MSRADNAIHDVCVVGGGPAGAALALRLAQLGRSVALVEKSTFPRPHVGESLSAGVHPLLQVLGVHEAVLAAGFVPATWATVAWAGETQRYQVHGGPGLLVDRGRFDTLLLRSAATAPGVRLYQPARALRAEQQSDGWSISLSTGESIRASFLAEAAGRAPLRRVPRSPSASRRLLGTRARTLARYAYWQRTDGEDGDTLVESGSNCWYWGAPLPNGWFNATVFSAPGERRDYQTLLSQSKLLGPALSSATQVSRVLMSDATPSAAQNSADARSLKVGDTALFVDPISSQGVQTAIGTALHAAIVLNTLIEHPEDTELALDFYRRRLQASANFHANAAADFYRRQADAVRGAEEHAAADYDFWHRRGEPDMIASSLEHVGKVNHTLIAPAARLTRAAGVELSSIAVASDRHVTRIDGIHARGRDYAFVKHSTEAALDGGIALAPLFKLIEAPMTAVEIVTRWSRLLPPRDALEVLQWVWSEGLLALAPE